MATLDDLRRLGYEVNVTPGPVEGMTIASVTGFGMYNNQTRCKSDGTGWEGSDQEALDSWADPAAHTERKFQAEHPDWHSARGEIERKGYIVERPDPTVDVFTIRAEGVKHEGIAGTQLEDLTRSLARPVSRDFKQDPRFADVDIPDWDLIEKVAKLIEQHLLPGAELSFRGHDRRGDFSAGDVRLFRAELEARDAPAERIVVGTSDREPQGSYRDLRVVMSPGFSRAYVASGDEILVNGLVARLSDMFEVASTRRTPAVVQSDPKGAAKPERGRVRSFLYDPWSSESAPPSLRLE